jgi:hypothetical protein
VFHISWFKQSTLIIKTVCQFFLKGIILETNSKGLNTLVCCNVWYVCVTVNFVYLNVISLAKYPYKIKTKIWPWQCKNLHWLFCGLIVLCKGNETVRCLFAARDVNYLYGYCLIIYLLQVTGALVQFGKLLLPTFCSGRTFLIKDETYSALYKESVRTAL